MTARAAAPAPAALSQAAAFDLLRHDPAGQAAIAARAGGFFAALDPTCPVRLLAQARPFSAEPALRTLTDLRRACRPDEDWRQSGLAAYQSFLETLTRRAALRGTEYFLLAWPGPHQPPAALFATAADSFLTRIEAVSDLPPFFADCREEWDHLAPRERGAAYLAVYGAYDFIGAWGPTTMHRLLRLPFQLAAACDVETLSPDRAQFLLQSAYNSLYAQLGQAGKLGGKDTRSEEAFADVQRALAALEGGERLHKVSLTVLIKAPTRAALRTNGALLTAALAPFLRLRLLRGQQAEALKFFTATPRRAIGVGLRARPVLSSGVSLFTPFGLPSRTETRGIFWGIDQATGNPVFYEGFGRGSGEGSRAFHATFFGFIGSGKTFSMLTLLYRQVLTGTQVVIIEPMGHFQRLATILGSGASYNRVAFETTSLNLLDIIHPRLPDQVAHVKRQLALLLSCESGAALAGRGEGRRVFSNAESALLGLALGRLYRSLWADRTRLDPATLAPQDMPRLGDLCAELERITEEQTGRPLQLAQALAAELRDLYVDGDLASSFNRPTTIDLRFDRPCTVFDVSGIDPNYRPLYYMQFCAVLDLFIRDRGRHGPVIVALDEFRYMIKDPTLAEQAHNLVKTARTFGCAVWSADQNPSTYTRSEYGEQIIALSTLVFIGRQQAEDVVVHRHLFPDLTDHHITQIRTAKRGQFIGIFGDDYYSLRIEPSPVELAAFRGT